ncbi:hypothetical protein JRQ81_005091 [Phrynocephalus forsythii]|uniref:Uncharacterized protein n=1 Tax=Phrynocephalus forsythii TaxID=171643 RepID=A0A9Q0XFY8_9SAUR|nr:hypothetical protein JRQ81_005091 [Phrynocephalus forsythii]
MTCGGEEGAGERARTSEPPASRSLLHGRRAGTGREGSSSDDDDDAGRHRSTAAEAHLASPWAPPRSVRALVAAPTPGGCGALHAGSRSSPPPPPPPPPPPGVPPVPREDGASPARSEASPEPCAFASAPRPPPALRRGRKRRTNYM